MKVGFCTGVFDGFHQGHQYFLRRCLDNCSHLVVAVNHDVWVTATKGKDRPFYPLAKRIWSIQAYLNGWDSVIPFNGDAEALCKIVQPDVVFLGYDQSANPLPFPVKVVGHLPGFSTTLLAQQKKLGAWR